jgi:3-methylcrotonyl-CoA carboxylase beta subunit
MTVKIKQSEIRTSSPEYKENFRNYESVIRTFRERLATVSSHGSEASVEKHRSRGKLLARERVNLLLDPQTPFLELSSFAAYNQYDNAFPSAGIITGIGVVQGRECLIITNDATVKGGTYIRETIKKHVRAQEVARQNKLVCIYLVDSGGIYLPEQAHVFPDRFDFGRVFYNQARMSAEGIPQISVVMGSCTAGGAYVPAMSDETIMVRNQGTIFIGGPPLIKAATGEEVTPEDLGGAEVHTSISGVADHIAEDDVHALQICRDIVAGLPLQEKQKLDVHPAQEPLFPEEELYGFLPTDLKKPINAHGIIERLVDGSEFQEFKANYGKTLVTGFARIWGFPVGIIANSSFLTSESSLKGAHFVQLCSQRKIPILFLQNITGFIVGKRYEHQGIARDGAKLINAVANASVPKFTIVIGGSFGAGNYAMAGRSFDPHFLFMWPHSRISVMGGEQASGVLESIGSNGSTDSLLNQFNEESSAYYSSSRLWDDGIIDPVDTRKILAMAISVSLNRPFGEPGYGVFRM